MFKSDYARPWWAVALREVWNDSTVAKREKEFFALVDEEFVAAMSRELGRDPGDKTDDPGEPPR